MAEQVFDFMGMSTKVSVITVCYNNAEGVRKLWSSLHNHEENFELIVVDNNSRDIETLQSIDAENFHLITLSENVGFGAANNHGVEFARGEVIALINPDVEIIQPVLGGLVEELQNNGIVAPKLQNPDGTTQWNARKFPSILTLFSRRFLRRAENLHLEENQTTPVPWVQGSFMVLKKSFYQSLQGFDERFFLFFEDTDLCRRSWEQQQSVCLVSKALAQHGHQRLSDGNLFTMWFKRTFWIHVNSAVKYFWKYKFKSLPDMSQTTKKGKIFFFSGPSGVGKGTAIDHLRKKYPDFVFPPSCTTRDPRPGEKDGETYYFITNEEFRRRIDAGEFLEYAEVHGGNLYGTLKHKLIDPVEEGKIVIREFDVQGFAQARERLPREYYESIFIRPEEGAEELMRRIKARAPISDEDLAHRMESMEKEIAMSDIYDHIIISEDGDLQKLFAHVEEVIEKCVGEE